jgi:hypothetical protein
MFEKHPLLKACTQSPWFFYPRPAHAFQSAGLADLLSFGGADVSLMPGAKFTVLSRLPVYSLIVGLTNFLYIFLYKINVVAFFM